MFRNKTLEEKYSELTGLVLGCYFEFINEIGIGYLELVYKNSLNLALKHKGMNVETEKPFEVRF